MSAALWGQPPWLLSTCGLGPNTNVKALFGRKSPGLKQVPLLSLGVPKLWEAFRTPWERVWRGKIGKASKVPQIQWKDCRCAVKIRRKDPRACRDTPPPTYSLYRSDAQGQTGRSGKLVGPAACSHHPSIQRKKVPSLWETLLGMNHRRGQVTRGGRQDDLALVADREAERGRKPGSTGRQVSQADGISACLPLWDVEVTCTQGSSWAWGLALTGGSVPYCLRNWGTAVPLCLTRVN